MAHEGPVRSMAPPSFGRTQRPLYARLRVRPDRTPQYQRRDNPHRLLREERCSTTRVSREFHHSPVAGDGAGARSEYSLDNSFLRSRRALSILDARSLSPVLCGPLREHAHAGGGEMSTSRNNRGAAGSARHAGHLDARDVMWSGGGGSTGRRPIRLPRSIGLSDYHSEALHVPTRVYVRGTVAKGHYTRRQMIEMRATLHRLIWGRLAHEVAGARTLLASSGGPAQAHCCQQERHSPLAKPT